MKWFLIGLAVAVVFVVARVISGPARARKKAVADALDRARKAAEAAPDEPGAQVALARAHLDLAEQPDEAMSILRRVEESSPRWWDGDGKPARMLIAEAHVAKGDLESAIAAFQTFVDDIGRYDTGDDSEKKWKLETHKVEAEQRIRLLKRGDTHVHQPEQWGDNAG